MLPTAAAASEIRGTRQLHLTRIGPCPSRCIKDAMLQMRAGRGIMGGIRSSFLARELFLAPAGCCRTNTRQGSGCMEGWRHCQKPRTKLPFIIGL